MVKGIPLNMLVKDFMAEINKSMLLSLINAHSIVLLWIAKRMHNYNTCVAKLKFLHQALLVHVAKQVTTFFSIHITFPLVFINVVVFLCVMCFPFRGAE